MPFGDRLADLPLLDRTFARVREDEVRASGVDPNRFTFAAHAFATAPLLKKLAAQTKGPSALAVPESSPLAALVPVSSVRRQNGALIFDVFCDAPPDATIGTLRARAAPVLVEHQHRTYRREFARLGPAPHHLDLPADRAVAAHVEHWVHLLWLAPLLVPRKTIVEKGARIHPTAHVERSFIGPDAIVGAQCSVRDSYVGAGARLADFTKFTRTVFGDGGHTLADATFSHVVSLGEGTLTNLLLRDVLIGRRCFLTTGVIFWGETLGENVTVDRDGVEVDTGRRLLGGCVGHGSVLGARTILAPGRALPNRTMVVMRKEEGIQKVASVAPGVPVCWHEGALVPYDQLRPGETPDELDDVRKVRPS